MGVTVEVGMELDIWYSGFTGIGGIETSMECGGAGATVVLRATCWAGSIWSRRVGGPATPSLGFPPTTLSSPPGSFGIILGVLRFLGPGGRPGPTLLPRGDIFCLNLAGLAGAWPSIPAVWWSPSLGPAWLTEGGRGAMAREMAVLPGGAVGTLLARLIWGI